MQGYCPSRAGLAAQNASRALVVFCAIEFHVTKEKVSYPSISSNMRQNMKLPKIKPRERYRKAHYYILLTVKGWSNTANSLSGTVDWRVLANQAVRRVKADN